MKSYCKFDKMYARQSKNLQFPEKKSRIAQELLACKSLKVIYSFYLKFFE